jgi:hypothetical protein
VAGDLGHEGNCIDVVLDEPEALSGMLCVTVEANSTAKLVKGIVTGWEEVQAALPALH